MSYSNIIMDDDDQEDCTKVKMSLTENNTLCWPRKQGMIRSLWWLLHKYHLFLDVFLLI